MTDLEKAERRLLKAVGSGKAISSAVLLARAEQSGAQLPGDTVRSAYWSLVSEGKLERTPDGVRRKA